MKNAVSRAKVLVLGGVALVLGFSTMISMGDAPEQTTTNAVSPAVIAPEIEATAPAITNVSPGVAEVAKLVQAGMSEEVILRFIASTDLAFSPSVEEVLYLNDLGVSDNIINAILDRAKEVRENAAAQATNNVPQTAVAPPVDTNAVVTPPLTPEVPATTVAYQNPNVTYFYDSLAPYGSWVTVADYGLCWRPTVVVSSPNWQPYCDRGRWMWTSCGWYWQSDYTWGWAPFHYGRWHRSHHYGWVWVPGTDWGPSWVSWRYSNDYCGWAPLPPEAHYRPGFGFTYHNSSVTLGFDFGIRSDCYTFVPANRFCDREVFRHRVGSRHVAPIYQKTVVNNYYINNNNVVINKGIAPERIAAASHTQIKEVAIHDVGRAPANRGEVLDKSRNALYVYRPPLPSATRMSNTRDINGAGSSFSSSGTAGSKPQSTMPSRREEIERRPGSVATAPTSSGTPAIPAGPGGTGRNDNRRPRETITPVPSTTAPTTPTTTTTVEKQGGKPDGNSGRHVGWTAPTTPRTPVTTGVPKESTPRPTEKVEKGQTPKPEKAPGNQRNIHGNVNSGRDVFAPSLSGGASGAASVPTPKITTPAPAVTPRSTPVIPQPQSPSVTAPRPTERATVTPPAFTPRADVKPVTPAIPSVPATPNRGQSHGNSRSFEVPRATPSYTPAPVAIPAPAPVTRSAPVFSAPASPSISAPRAITPSPRAATPSVPVAVPQMRSPSASVVTPTPSAAPQHHSVGPSAAPRSQPSSSHGQSQRSESGGGRHGR